MRYALEILLAVLVAGPVFAAGSLAESWESMAPPDRIRLTWTADTNGNVAVTSQPVRGEMARVVFYNGTPAPTNATYPVTLKDAYGVDALAGQGSAVTSNEVTAGYQLVPGALVESTAGVTNLHPGFVVNGPLSVGVSGVGSNASGVIVVFVK